MAGGVEGVGKIDRRKKSPPPSRICRKTIASPHDTVGNFLPCFKNMPLCCCCSPTTVLCNVTFAKKKVRKIMRKKKIAFPKKYAKKSWPPPPLVHPHPPPPVINNESSLRCTHAAEPFSGD